ncbi:unnamed protein product [Arctogadus glacialis]
MNERIYTRGTRSTCAVHARVVPLWESEGCRGQQAGFIILMNPPGRERRLVASIPSLLNSRTLAVETSNQDGHSSHVTILSLTTAIETTDSSQ